MQSSAAVLVRQFVEAIWNQQFFTPLPQFVHADYIDLSLPADYPTGIEGTKAWILNTGKSFIHHTIIEDQVTEGNKSILKISMKMKHIGPWREIPPTAREVTVSGYRFFHLTDGKISSHQALIDGQSLEKQLKL